MNATQPPRTSEASAPRYVRAQHLDRRFAWGDDHAADGWIDRETGRARFVAVGHDPNEQDRPRN